jgi:hypothetical protein
LGRAWCFWPKAVQEPHEEQQAPLSAFDHSWRWRCFSEAWFNQHHFNAGTPTTTTHIAIHVPAYPCHLIDLP